MFSSSEYRYGILLYFPSLIFSASSFWLYAVNGGLNRRHPEKMSDSKSTNRLLGKSAQAEELLTTMHRVHTANIPRTKYLTSRCMTSDLFAPERQNVNRWWHFVVKCSKYSIKRSLRRKTSDTAGLNSLGTCNKVSRQTSLRNWCRGSGSSQGRSLRASHSV